MAPDRVGEVPAEGAGEVRWISAHDVEKRLRALREDASAWRQASDTGQFSLSGAQPKTALLREGKRWGVPSGRMPTTHILKPGALGLDGHAENEHLCLLLAREVGLPAAASELMHFGDEVAIVVERYDRVRTPSGIARAHQEDTCQVLGVHPTRKYENEGGPGVASIAEIRREHSRAPAEDIGTFINALAFLRLASLEQRHEQQRDHFRCVTKVVIRRNCSLDRRALSVHIHFLCRTKHIIHRTFTSGCHRRSPGGYPRARGCTSK